MHVLRLPRLSRAATSLFLVGLIPLGADQRVYEDSLQNGWENWSWATVDLSATAPVHGGTRAISVTASGWEALYLHCPAQDTSGYTNLAFWLHGGTGGGQSLQVQATLGNDPQAAVVLPSLVANTWTEMIIPLSSLGVANQTGFDGFWIQIRTAASVPTFYVDDITLVSGAAAPPTSNAPVSIVVDALADRHPIHPLIYGVNFATSEQLAELNVPWNRSGGNATTRYNWEANASNHAADWYFESLPRSGAQPGAEVDDFIRETAAGGAAPAITIPINGWVAKVGPNRQRLCSYSIAKYGPQTDSDAQWFPDAGNGLSATNNGQRITTNDPTDANQAVAAAFQAGWLEHLTARWGRATNGGVRYYLMDNEWGLWHETHRDVHKVGSTMEQMRDRFCDHALLVKAHDADALVLGPEEWGWTGYFYSGYDSQYASEHGWSSFPDRAAHGGQDLMPWLLKEIRQRSEAAGQRLLDVFTLHFYPQSGEFGNDVSTTAQLRRNRSTRALWDPSYVDSSWIDDTVKLIPRMKQWATNYPGTLLGITEYNWGAEEHINGATAQADILGIFGREGLDLAARWVVPETGTPVYRAFQIYRNYDGARSTFGETSVRATGGNPDQLAAFAAVRAKDAALTVVVINKTLDRATPVTLSLSNFPAASPAQVWQLTSANTITRLADLAVTGAVVSNEVPAQSITLLVVPSAAPRLQLAASTQPGWYTLTLHGVAGQPYVTEVSSDLAAWTALTTNTAISNVLTIPIEQPPTIAQFYRARLNP